VLGARNASGPSGPSGPEGANDANGDGQAANGGKGDNETANAAGADVLPPRASLAGRGRILTGHRRREPSRLRQRVNGMLDHVLSDDSADQAGGRPDGFREPRGPSGGIPAVWSADDGEDEFWGPPAPAQEGFWPDEPDEPDPDGEIALDYGEPAGDYRSKHRLPSPAEHPYDDDQSDGHRRAAPRHAAPPASFSAKLTNVRMAGPKPPRLAGKSSHAAW
jgi:hypothetical protein